MQKDLTLLLYIFIFLSVRLLLLNRIVSQMIKDFLLIHSIFISLLIDFLIYLFSSLVNDVSVNFGNFQSSSINLTISLYFKILSSLTISSQYHSALSLSDNERLSTPARFEKFLARDFWYQLFISNLTIISLLLKLNLWKLLATNSQWLFFIKHSAKSLFHHATVMRVSSLSIIIWSISNSQHSIIAFLVYHVYCLY